LRHDRALLTLAGSVDDHLRMLASGNMTGSLRYCEFATGNGGHWWMKRTRRLCIMEARCVPMAATNQDRLAHWTSAEMSSAGAASSSCDSGMSTE
jgi:hypothetical protein